MKASFQVFQTDPFGFRHHFPCKNFHWPTIITAKWQNSTWTYYFEKPRDHGWNDSKDPVYRSPKAVP
ncbi:MAG: hypothetical protein IPL08_17300 [Saprospiraceae bacterium]|nr:hypothetical protein [Saprospiraceae bacterium]